MALLDTGRLVERGAARAVIERPEIVEAARLVGLGNLFPAAWRRSIRAAITCRLECDNFALTAPYLKGHLHGDRVWVAIRPADVRVHAGEIQADVNFVALHLLRVLERARTVRMEFAGGFAAEISRDQFARQKDNKGWQLEFPPAALRVF